VEPLQKIEMLLKEYDTLRSEMIERFRQRFQFVTIIGAVGAFALFTKKHFTIFQIVILALTPIVLLCTVWFWIGHLIVKASQRIAQIETEINSLAESKLLCWETEQVNHGLLHHIHVEIKK